MRRKLLVIGLILCLSVIMTACGKNSGQESTNASASSGTASSELASPSDAADQFMKAVKQKDEKTLDQIYLGDTEKVFGALESEDIEDAVGEKTMEQVEDKLFGFKYELGEEKIDGDKASVDVNIRTYDFGGLIGDFMQDYFANAISAALKGKDDSRIQEDALKTFRSRMKDLEFSSDRDATIWLTKKDGEWVVKDLSSNTTFLDALTGGAYSRMIKISKQVEKLTS